MQRSRFSSNSISIVSIAGLCASLLFAVATQAQPRPMEEGRHYATISPAIDTATGADVIEILDVFWYGCPVCGEFEPMMSYYGGEIRGDLKMHRMPAIWNPLMKLHARLYYTALALDLAERIHPAAFRHIQVEQKPLNSVEQVRAFFVAAGVPAADFDKAWSSDEVADAVARAERNTQAAGIDRLPALVINGRYRVVRNEGVPELPEVVVTANQLIRTLRDERRVD